MPSSKRRQAASRANGKKSRGPVTPEGKAKAAANSTRHGLSASSSSSPPVLPADPNTARAVCLRNESRAEFARFHQTFVDELKPATPIEAMLVEELAILRWRIHRSWHLETALLDNEMDNMDIDVAAKYENMDGATRAALAYRCLAEDSPSLALLNRYESRLSRQWDRCFARLAALRQSAAAPDDVPNEPNPGNGHSPDDSELQRRTDGDVSNSNVTSSAAPVPAAQPDRPGQSPAQPAPGVERIRPADRQAGSEHLPGGQGPGLQAA